MALGFGSKKSNNEDDNAVPMQDGRDFGSKNYYAGFTPDTEAQGGNAPRKMSRLDRPTTGSIAGHMSGRRSFDANAPDEDISIGKQVEMEAGNAIKYRTCSWQKV